MTLLRFVFGRTRREVAGTVFNWLLIATVVILAFELKQASRSPNPRLWNHYSNEANDHLYEGAAVPERQTVVAHKAGAVPGSPAAGQIDRLTANYRRGQRLFEIDFAWTSDDELVLVHDWESYEAPAGSSIPPSLAEFLEHDPQRHASMFTLYEWLAGHPDAFIVTDCKKRSLACLERIRMERPELVPRFIPQIYQLKDFDLARARGFRHIVLTLYRSLAGASGETILDFARTHELFAVTMPQSRADESDLASLLRDAGVAVYVHTINDVEVARSMQERGAWGVYSDTLNPSDLPPRDEPSRTTPG